MPIDDLLRPVASLESVQIEHNAAPVLVWKILGVDIHLNVFGLAIILQPVLRRVARRAKEGHASTQNTQQITGCKLGQKEERRACARAKTLFQIWQRRKKMPN